MFNTKNIILASLFALGGTFVVYLVFFHTSSPEGYEGSFDVQTEQFRIYGEDGTILPVTRTTPVGDGTSMITVIHPDRGLNGDWNSSGIQFQTGTFLRRSLASHGISAISFDQRGTGQSVISGKNRSAPETLVKDFLSVERAILDRKKTKKIDHLTYLGHGEGCAYVLLAALEKVNKNERKPDQILLTGCAYSGTLLENWGARLIFNMEKAGVEPELIKNARDTLQFWLKKQKSAGPSHSSTPDSATGTASVHSDGNLKTGETQEAKQMHPDLIAFYNALNYAESDEMRRWTKEASKIHIPELIKKAIQNGISVHQFAGTTDEEIPSSEWDEQKKFRDTLYTDHPNRKHLYSLKEVNNADHFFIQRESSSSSIVETALRRMNPFFQFNETLIQDLLKKYPSAK